MRMVGRTIKEHRRDKRRSFEIPASLNGVPVLVTDLSLGGVAAGADAIEIDGETTLDLRPGQCAVLRLPRNGNHSKSFEVEIVRSERREGRVGLRFTALNDDQYRLVEQLVLRPSRVLAD